MQFIQFRRNSIPRIIMPYLKEFSDNREIYLYITQLIEIINKGIMSSSGIHQIIRIGLNLLFMDAMNCFLYVFPRIFDKYKSMT